MNQIDLFCLHHIFVPRINAQLDTFHQTYSRHLIRTERNRIPLQLWVSGMNTTTDEMAASEVYDHDCECMDEVTSSKIIS